MEQLNGLESLRSLDINWDRHGTAFEREGWASAEQLLSLNDLGIQFEVAEDETAQRRTFSRVAASSSDPETDGYWQTHHDYDEMTLMLHEMAEEYASIARLYSIGQSVEGRELWVMRISDNVLEREVEEPQFKYIGNMHGDEVVGRELLLRFIYVLLSQYQRSQDVTSLVDSTEIHIMPSMNPDGYEHQRRSNANYVDLNRNFPDRLMGGGQVEPEVSAVMDWILSNHFILSANLHGGDLVVNYPYDGNEQGISGIYSACPDDALFRHISLTYSELNEPMYSSMRFENGITNGAAWYVLYGGMQDWNYVYSGSCFEVTIELYSVKWPSPTMLTSLWNDNRDSLMAYMAKVHQGVRGQVVTQSGSFISDATISINSYGQDVVVDPESGWYFRPLPPGPFVVSCTVDGVTKTVPVVISSDAFERVDFTF